MASYVGGALVSRETVGGYKDITLTNAQVLALRATPQTLVGAPGKANVLRLPERIVLVASLTGAYTETADNLVIRQTNGTGVILSETIETTGWLDQTGIKGTSGRYKIDTIGMLLNKALVLHNSGDGEFGGGNAANTLKIRTFYRDFNLTGYGTLA